MNSSIISHSSLFLIALSSSLFLGSCANKDKDQVAPVGIESKVSETKSGESTEMADIMRSKGMKIYNGENPIDFRGDYEISDIHLVAVSGQEDQMVTDGLPYQDYRFKFSRGHRGEMVISYSSLDGTDQGISTEAKVEGSGNDFTISAEMVGVIQGMDSKFQLILSGSTGDLRKGWEFAIIMKAKSNNRLTVKLIREGSYRIFKGNGSQLATTTPSIERRVNPQNRIFGKSLLDLR